METLQEKEHIIKINLPGGIVAAGDLCDILNAAERAGIKNVRFGTRQQVFFSVKPDMLEDLEQDFMISDISYEIDSDIHPNIISSYVTEDIFDQSNWLREGVYKDVLDMFDYQPKLKVNLVDSNQTFIPFFTGNLNFIASDTGNYWFLYVRFPKTNIIYLWPALIYSGDIAAVSKAIERAILANRDKYYDQPEIDGNILFESLNSSSFASQPINHKLKLPDFALPYYEGFNRYDSKYWLGIYRRDELFPVSFLKEICAACIKTRTGQIYTTPWKSIIIKGIESSDRFGWSNILSKYRINLRHAANELNWQIEDLCDEGLQLKQYLIKEFDKVDLRTFMLSFAIKCNPKTGLFGSVIIRKQKNDEPQPQQLFDILYTHDFNPNSKTFTLHRAGLEAAELPVHLIALCHSFYEVADHAEPNQALNAPETAQEEEAKIFVHQCKNCLTIYDEEFGDEFNEIATGIPFDELPASYCCPTCETGKEDFIPVEKNILVL